MLSYKDIVKTEYGIKVCKSQYKWLAEYLDAIPVDVYNYIFGNSYLSPDEFKTTIADYFDGLIYITITSGRWVNNNNISEDDIAAFDNTMYDELRGIDNPYEPIAEGHPYRENYRGEKRYRILYDRPICVWLDWIGHDLKVLIGYLSSLGRNNEHADKRKVFLDFCRPMFKTIYQQCKILVDKESMDYIPIVWVDSRRDGFYRQILLDYDTFTCIDNNGNSVKKYYTNGKLIMPIGSAMYLRMTDLKYYTFDEYKKIIN